MKLTTTLLSALLVTITIPALAGIKIGGGGYGINVDTSGVNITGMGSGVTVDSDDASGSLASGNSINGVDKVATIRCTSKNPNASIQGSDNTVTITGTCNTIQVQGAGNKVTAQAAKSLYASGADVNVTIQKVDSIVGQGADATVRYHSGLTKAMPTVRMSGADARASKF